MKEYILVEFLIEYDRFAELYDELTNFGEDLIILSSSSEEETDENGYYQAWIRLDARMSSQCATILKLQHPVLSDRMRISYIPDDLKDKYRTK
jgi:hypothetical protein